LFDITGNGCHREFNFMPVSFLGRPMKIQLVGDGAAQTSPRPAASGRVPNRQGNFR